MSATVGAHSNELDFLGKNKVDKLKHVNLRNLKMKATKEKVS